MTSPIPTWLALLVTASVNKAPVTIVASVFGYTIGLVVVITAFVAWQSRRRTARR